ncbi:hypothetical protein AALO_G00020930 [Alosa alosa]|uniref:Uncharacterized protein n=1 Tax=Alosa alosa TaxID=278164 RepID=A0AAV6H940_9TELE|nr:hypothetical protein AALO_G00020930 [Alosa alosa]
MDGAQSRTSVPSHLGFSIFNTLCCCLPLGIAAIVYSCRVDNANAMGDGARALESSRTAKNLNIAGLIIGIILIIILIVYQIKIHS